MDIGPMGALHAMRRTRASLCLEGTVVGRMVVPDKEDRKIRTGREHLQIVERIGAALSASWQAMLPSMKS